ncbi:LbetaH domain-containing protein [Oerskovia enterophila]|uniref:UDP-3-O-(3-hydroxymyristoyl)glucosamine N-acyltransferase n=1 Tax=Oerskovia enterophila TaxID=43678 RepID=A0ABX2Y4L3_9CELL|nr:hypothetical protein [Oerskovia enterophila]OCI31503.1 hypothetical protein OERS_17760 [Oerskovia enterophila]
MTDPPDPQQPSAPFLDRAGIDTLVASGVVVPAPDAVWVSPRARIAAGAVLHPTVVVSCDEASSVVVARDAVLHPGTRISATEGGSVRVGERTILGPGGCTLVADGDKLHVGPDGRYRMALLLAPGAYGDGCQVLGPIEARGCTLEGGEPGDSPDVASRGALLKGAGRAAGITLARGQVVNGAGDFRRAPVEEQTDYHPPRPTAG